MRQPEAGRWGVCARRTGWVPENRRRKRLSRGSGRGRSLEEGDARRHWWMVVVRVRPRDLRAGTLGGRRVGPRRWKVGGGEDRAGSGNWSGGSVVSTRRGLSTEVATPGFREVSEVVGFLGILVVVVLWWLGCRGADGGGGAWCVDGRGGGDGAAGCVWKDGVAVVLGAEGRPWRWQFCLWWRPGQADRV